MTSSPCDELIVSRKEKGKEKDGKRKGNEGNGRQVRERRKHCGGLDNGADVLNSHHSNL